MGINNIRIIGTGHIFEKSVLAVEEIISEEKPDIVAIELDKKRFKVLQERGFRLDSGIEEVKLKTLIKDLVRGGSFPVFLAGILALLQKEVGKEYGITPGSDMLVAIHSAKNFGCKIALIDRDIDITLNHILSIPLKEKIRLLTHGREEVKVLGNVFGLNLEGLLEEENVVILLKHLKKEFPVLYSALVDERDRYMAAALLRLKEKHLDSKIVAVLGAGHKKGVEEYLNNPDKIDLGDVAKIRKISRLSILLLLVPLTVTYILLKIKFRKKR